MHLSPLKKAEVPEPISLRKMVGPSLILVGLGLGTGELILWPYLASNWGMGIIWGAFLGITMQFFLNMEIERYALANGESIFVGFARIFRILPVWFIVSSLIAWSWPAFSAASTGALVPFGLQNTTTVNIGMLILVGIILTLGPVLYKTVETFQKILISLAVPTIVIIAASVIDMAALKALFLGMVGIGDGYLFFPNSEEFPFMTFLAAFAYSGAGGNLLLAQSFYVKEKGYAMGKYAGRITSLITGKEEHVELEGTTFEDTPLEVEKYNVWWRRANLEHLFVFWGLGLFTMLLLATISFATIYGQAGNATGINFLYNESAAISEQVGPFFGAALLIIVCLMLFATQLTVIDASGRIIAENMGLIFKNKIQGNQMPKIYYGSIWTLLTFGVIVLLSGLKEPQTLIVLGAVINAVCMFVFAGLLIKTNMNLLPESIKPALWRRLVIYFIFAFFGIFSFLVIADNFLPWKLL